MTEIESWKSGWLWFAAFTRGRQHFSPGLTRKAAERRAIRKKQRHKRAISKALQKEALRKQSVQRRTIDV